MRINATTRKNTTKHKCMVEPKLKENRKNKRIRLEETKREEDLHPQRTFILFIFRENHSSITPEKLNGAFDH